MLILVNSLQEAGGPKIPMKYGRVDVTGPEQCPPEGKLPGWLISSLDFAVLCIQYQWPLLVCREELTYKWYSLRLSYLPEISNKCISRSRNQGNASVATLMSKLLLSRWNRCTGMVPNSISLTPANFLLSCALQMLAQVHLLTTWGRYSTEWALMTRCADDNT